MKLRTIWMGVAIVLGIGGCGERPEGGASVEEARFEGDQIATAAIDAAGLQRARDAADALTRDLGSLVLTTLQEQGPVAAIEVCSNVAQERTASHAAEGLYLRRVSDRLRNPENAPDEAEARELSWMAASGATPQEVARIVRQGDERWLHYMRPIVLAQPCATCHGPPESIPPEVHEILRERYPDDRAVGYQPGDLRGAVSVRVDLD